MARRGRLRWHAHVESKDDGDNVKACTRLVVGGRRLSAVRGRPGRTEWRPIGWRKANPAVSVREEEEEENSTPNASDATELIPNDSIVLLNRS